VKVGAVGLERRADHLIGVRRCRIEDVVVPVAVEDRPVTLEIVVICRGGIGRGEDREELRHEVDEHEVGRPQFGNRPRRRQARASGFMP
jgi:hypothetical protein